MTVSPTAQVDRAMLPEEAAGHGLGDGEAWPAVAADYGCAVNLPPPLRLFGRRIRLVRISFSKSLFGRRTKLGGPAAQQHRECVQVTVITPTCYDRQSRHANLLQMWRQQDYAGPLELIVIAKTHLSIFPTEAVEASIAPVRQFLRICVPPLRTAEGRCWSTLQQQHAGQSAYRRTLRLFVAREPSLKHTLSLCLCHLMQVLDGPCYKTAHHCARNTPGRSDALVRANSTGTVRVSHPGRWHTASVAISIALHFDHPDCDGCFHPIGQAAHCLRRAIPVAAC